MVGAGGDSAGGAGGDVNGGGAGGESSRGAGGVGAAGSPGTDLLALASAFDGLFIHDTCTGANPSQPDTCIHEQEHEESFSFAGEPGTTYEVTLRIRGLFEPTTVMGGEAPDPDNPYFKIDGTVSALDYSHWHIEVSEPAHTYWLNHYPQTSHTIYQEDFEVTLSIAAGASVAVRVIDGNDRQIDNAATGLDDRQQVIDGVTEGVLDGQVLRVDVIDVVEASAP